MRKSRRPHDNSHLDFPSEFRGENSGDGSTVLKPLGKIANSLTYFLLLSFFILSASPSFAQLIPKTNWTLAFVDSQETVGANGAATNSFDGNPATHWHTQWFNINPDPPPPHEIQINLGAVYNVSGFRYLPRQDGSQNGRIKQYEFYVSLDGVNWGTPVASGIFLNDGLEKEVTFTTPKAGHYVLLGALSEVNSNPWTSMAELNVLGTLQIAPGNLIPQTNWLASVDSQEVVFAPRAGTKSFDGDPSTFWHTQWSDIEPDPPPPHEIQINLGAVYNVSGFRYLPRQDGAQNGWVGQFEFYVSSDGSNWDPAVFTGTFGKNASEKEVLFTAKTGQYVRFRALSEVNGNPWTSAAELNVLGNLSPPTITSIVPNSGPAAGGQTGVVITGTNLSGATIVTFGGTAATITNNTATTVTVTTPAHAAGAVNVVATVSAGSATSTGGYTYTSTAPAPTKLALTSINGGANPTVGAVFPVVVQAQDAGGNPSNVIATTAVSLSLKTGTGSLGGTLTGSITAGSNQVTITGVTYSKAESGVVITATRTSGDVLAAGDSAAFTVNPGAANILAFTTQPGNATPGGVIPGPPTVTVRDSLGNTVTSSSASITIAIGTNPGPGILSGTLTKSAVSGVASFSDLSINQAGDGYTLAASSASLTGATSSAFNITATAPAITSINPTSGPVGTSVMITGTNFGTPQGTSTVKFNGTTATSITSWSATSIVAVVPAGATTGLVVVTVSGLASNGVTFTVTIPKNGWTLLFVDSQETVGANGAATNSFDGNPATHWHTEWSDIEPDPPPPHEIQINLGAVYSVSGFRYLPRQDNDQNGRIKQYEFYVSSDGANWGSPVATGIFANTEVEKQVLFAAKTGQYVSLRAVSEVNGNPWTSMAELSVLQGSTAGNQAPDGVIDSPAANATIVVGSAINFTGTGTDLDDNTPLTYHWSFGTGSGIPDTTAKDPGLLQFNVPGTFVVTFTVADALGLTDPIPPTRTITVQSGSSGVPIAQTNWTLLFVDSQEVVSAPRNGTKSFDGDPSTFWHTQWFNVNPDPPPPHEIQINLGAVYSIGGFRYLPRQDFVNGRIAQYEFYVSLDDINWGSPVATGTFPNTTIAQEVTFIPKPGQYVRLRALSEVNGNPWTSMAELNVLQAACITPSVTLIQPQSYFLQTSANLYLLADACLAGEQGVRLMVDGGTASGGAQFDDNTAPYEVTFTGLGQFEHVVDAFVIDTGGNPVPGNATHDQAIQVGVGDYTVTMGDSITFGAGDTVSSDNISQDGRNTGGGYTPILDDLLTADRAKPQAVVNEGVGGARSAGGLSLIPTLLQRHPDAQRFLIMYGTNDANIFLPTPSGLGLQPVVDSGYAGSFKDNMQRIIDAIQGAGKIATLAKAPVALPLDSQRNTNIQQFNLVIDELVAANNITVTPPDFHAYFATHYPTEYWDDIHPNGVGYQSMANLWVLALP